MCITFLFPRKCEYFAGSILIIPPSLLKVYIVKVEGVGGCAERGTGLCGGSLNPWPKEGSTPQTVASRRKIQFQTLFCEYSRASGSVHDKSIGKFQL